MKNTLIKGLLLIFLGLGALSCTVQREVVSSTPTTHRQALVYDDYVVVVTRTTITREHYDRLKAKTVENRDKK